RVDDRGAFSLAERMAPDHLPRGRERLQPHPLRDAHPDALASVDAPHTVPRPFVRDQTVPADLARQRVDSNVARRWQRGKVRYFFRKAVDRPLMRREMLPHIEDLDSEAREIAAERVEVGPAVALDEMILDELKGLLDFAFGPRPPHPAGAGFDPIVATQLPELRIPGEVPRARPDDERTRVVDQGVFRDAAEVPEGLLEGLVDRGRRLIAARPVELAAAIAQDGVVHYHAGVGAT